VSFYVDTQEDGGSWKSVSYAFTQPDTWYHLVGVYNTTHMTLYVNGEQENSDTQAGSIDPGWSSFTVGCDSPGNQHFNGTLDEVYVYEESLTADEVAAIHSAHS